MVELGRNFEAIESVDVTAEVKEAALAEGFTVFGEEGDLGFGILKGKERFYCMDGVLFHEDEMPEDGVKLNDLSEVRAAVVAKIRPNQNLA